MRRARTSFAEYYQAFFIRPQQTATALVADPQRLRLGMLAFLIPAVLYTLVYVFLIFGGGEPFKPWLAIPASVYYRYNVFLLAPSMFLCWILAAGVVQLLGHFCSATGTFEDTLSVLGFGIAVASWSTLAHDLVSSFLGAIHVIDQRAYEAALNSPTVWRSLLWVLLAAYVIWFPVVFAAGIRAAQHVRRGQAAFLGTVAFIAYQAVFLVFNR